MATPHSQSSAVRTHFKTPEGRYSLTHEKSHPTGLLHYSHNKAVTLVTLAHLKGKPAGPSATGSNSSSGTGTGSRFTAARLLGAGNGSRTLGFGGNGYSRMSGSAKTSAPLLPGAVNGGPAVPAFDGEGTYLIFNVSDALFISDVSSQDKDPVKCIQFNGANPICHSFDADAKDGHDLLIGLSTGDVYSASLRQQLQDSGKKLVGATHYNKDGAINNSRCTSVSWVPRTDGIFVAAHADGNLYVYDRSKDGSGDVSFPPIKDPAQFTFAHARSSKSNPIARWHICQGAINGIAFSADGLFMATVGRDGYLRIFDYSKEVLACGCKSYFGALLCCAWSPDGKYVLTGGEDDLVQVWSMEDQAIVAWGEGHNSWVSGVAFDSFWTSPPSDDSGDGVTYRFGSVGQDAQLLLWDLAMDEVVMPLRRLAPSASSPTLKTGNWDSSKGAGYLHPAPVRKEVPKLSPVMAHRVHAEPLSGLLFTKEAILTACHEGHVKIWDRPCHPNHVIRPSDSLSADNSADKLSNSK